MPGGLHRRRCSGRRSIVIHRRRRRRLQERLVTSQTFGKVGLTLLRRRPDEAEALCRYRLEGVGVAAQAATGGVVQHVGRVGLAVADASVARFTVGHVGKIDHFPEKKTSMLYIIVGKYLP